MLYNPQLQKQLQKDTRNTDHKNWDPERIESMNIQRFQEKKDDF